MRRARGASLAVGLLFAIAACQSLDLRALDGTEWRVISIPGIGAALPTRPPLLSFKRDVASGSGFCSTYTLSGMAIDDTANPPRLSFDGASMQSSDCPDERERADRAYIDALAQARSIRLEGGRLVIDGKGGMLVFERVVPAP